MEMTAFNGYHRLRRGKIHLYCPGCKRKMSNARRDIRDPPLAVLVHVLCTECAEGTLDSGQKFFGDDGRELCAMCGRSACELALGNETCDGRLWRKLERVLG